MTRRMNKLYFKNYLLLFFVIVIIFSIFSVYTYENSKKVIREELSKSNAQTLDSMSNYVDSFITDTKYMISSLIISNAVEFTLSSPSSEFVRENYQKQLQELLLSLQYSNKAIESIYLYCEDTNIIYHANSINSLDSFSDSYWLENLNPDKHGFSIFPYAVYNNFPYTMCVAKEFEINGHRSVICFLLNLAKLPLLQNVFSSDDDASQFYLITDDCQVIYSRSQRDLSTPVSEFETLQSYDAMSFQKSDVYERNASSPYSFSQKHSDKYPWTYALYIPLQDYLSRLSSTRAITLSIFFLFIIIFAFITLLFLYEAIKPLYRLRNLLDNADLLNSDKKTSVTDIDYIAGKITQYVQVNQQLAAELEHRLHLLLDTQKQALQLQINPHFLFNSLNVLYIQAVDSLGFEHTLPDSIQNLCTLLRYALSPDHMVTMETELRHTDIYLRSLNMRYEKNLTVNKKIDNNVLSAKVPRLFMQPIIENSIYHGFSGSQYANNIITLCCYKNSRIVNDNALKDYIILEISDNGTGIDELSLLHIKNIISGKVEPAPGKNIGIKNVADRLALFYANEATIEINSTPQTGTTFIFTLPVIN